MDEDEHWRKVTSWFHELVACGEPECRARLDEIGASNPAVRAELEELLAAHRLAEGLSAEAEHRPLPIELPSERRLGAYRLVRSIGHGGMGIVYLAERADRQFEKRVAVKLIRRGLDTAAVLARFRSESRILAALEHPNIARLLDAGTTPAGLPYLVMEYIDGAPVDSFCAARRLDVTERITLFRQICAAVTFAHQRLVVHRDIKPSNILVTEDGAPHLLDFGIARIVDPEAGNEATLTAVGLRALTPAYASPEQLAGEPASTLGDVYSLGVVLHVLLTGRLPVRATPAPAGATGARALADAARPSDVVAQATDATATAPPLPAEQLRRRLRGDLDTIVRTALRSDPQHRYSSVEQLSEDLRRHLVGLPIQARAERLGYRLSRFVRRHRAGVAAALLVLASLLAGIVATSWQARRARRAQASAEKRLGEVRRLAHALLFDYHDAIQNLPGATPVRAMLVRDALAYLDGLASEGRDDPSLARELAAAYKKVGDVQGAPAGASLGETAGALASYRKAVDLYEVLLTRDAADREANLGLATTLLELGPLEWLTGAADAGLGRIRRAAAILEPVRLAEPEDPSLADSLARAYDREGMILVDRDQADLGIARFRAALATIEALPAEARDAEARRRAVAVACEHLGMAQAKLGDLESAVTNNLRALELRSALASDFPLNAEYRRSVGVSRQNLGKVLVKEGRIREALESFRQAAAIADGLRRADPQSEQYRSDYAYALTAAGELEVAEGDLRAAVATLTAARDLRAADVEADPEHAWKLGSLLESQSRLALALWDAGDRARAEVETAATLALVERAPREPYYPPLFRFAAERLAELARAEQAAARSPDVAPAEHAALTEAACSLLRRATATWSDLASRETLEPRLQEQATEAERALTACTPG